VGLSWAALLVFASVKTDGAAPLDVEPVALLDDRLVAGAGRHSARLALDASF
jgi:hypothetical protein